MLWLRTADAEFAHAVIERGAIHAETSCGARWTADDPTRFTPTVANGANTLEAVERDHILRVLSETGWVIGGPGGAAARLGMNRTTLNHRMRKLGISRPQPQHS